MNETLEEHEAVAVEEASAEYDQSRGEEEFLAMIEGETADTPTVAFSDLDALFATEQLEDLGVWREWPDMPGAEVLVAFFSACNQKRMRLEEQLRAANPKYKVTVDGAPPLPDKVAEQLWVTAMEGTVLKGWRGLRVAPGSELGRRFEIEPDGTVPFTHQNFVQMMGGYVGKGKERRKVDGSRNFRVFVLKEARNQDAIRNEAAKAAKKA